MLILLTVHAQSAVKVVPRLPVVVAGSHGSLGSLTKKLNALMQPVFLGSLLTTSTMVWPRQCAVGYSLLSCQALAMYCWLLSTVMTGIGSVLLAIQYCHVGHWQYTVGYSVLSYCIGSVLLATQYRHVRH